MSSQFVSDCGIFEGNNMRAELAERGLERQNPTLPGALHSPFFHACREPDYPGVSRM